MSRDTLWSHAPRASRVEFPQAAPDGPAQTQTFSIQSSFGNRKFFDIRLEDDVDDVTNSSGSFKIVDSMF